MSEPLLLCVKMDSERQKRKKEIQKALTFIESPLPYADPVSCTVIVSQLVENLLLEGNALYKEGNGLEAVKELSEGLSVVQYSSSEDMLLSPALVGQLYVDRATVYYSLGEYERSVCDCEQALSVNKESSPALLCKALSLKELGLYKEAYNCTTDCLLFTRLDERVNELAQELAILLGLKNRKAYVTSRGNGLGNSLNPSHGTANIAPSVLLSSALKPNSLSHLLSASDSSKPQAVLAVTTPVTATGPPTAAMTLTATATPLEVDLDTLDDFELIGEDLDNLLDCFPNESEPTKTHIPGAFPAPPTSSAHQKPVRFHHTPPGFLPAPSPLLPPAFFSSALGHLNTMDTLSAPGGGGGGGVGGGGGRPGPDSRASVLDAFPPHVSHNLDTLDSLDSLDTLDSFTPAPKTQRSRACGEVYRNAGPVAVQPTVPLDQLDTLGSLDQLDTLGSLDQLDTLGSLDQLDTLGSLDQLDTLGILDQLDTPETLDRLDTPDDSQAVQRRGCELGAAYDHTCLDGSLDDFLDSLQGCRAGPAFPSGGDSLDVLDYFAPLEEDVCKPGIKSSHKITAPAKHSPQKSTTGSAAPNPMSATHQFLEACSVCFPRQARSIYSYVHKPDVSHHCQQDILLCRRRKDPEGSWTRVRPIPFTKPFAGKFVLCKELLSSGEVGLCKYEERCTFAFNQLEIDVWTEERRGALDRTLLFQQPTLGTDPGARVLQLIQEHNGMFMFLCEKCYDGKPSVISKRCQDDRTTCSNPCARHAFDTNKCLAYVKGPSSVSYRKVRPFHSSVCSLELCRHAARYGCQLEDACLFAHSPVELKTWMLQRDTGITYEEIVDKSIKYHGEREPDTKWKNPLSSGGRSSGSQSLNLKLKFICPRCWQNGLITEPDKALQYCTAKGRHSWTKERRVLLVMSPERSKWVQVRPLPVAKYFPAQYDICGHILEKRKCNYTGNCTFAHSLEEKELWTYMKNHDLKDMQQLYDVWLSLTHPNRKTNGVTLAPPPAPAVDKCIVMPTDFAEPMSGFYCRLCGRHSNSERQWQRHISTETHKDRVFTCEGEDGSLTWSHRFPGLRFHLCPKLDSECPEGVCCDYAHSPEELQEWTERRDYLRRKLAKAREDMLITPHDVDFGKFNFLLQD